MKKINIIFWLLFILAVLNFTKSYSQTSNNLFVLVKYKTQPGKDSLALLRLKNLISNVKNEPNYVNIVIHIDPNDKTNILLYEEWKSEIYYKGEHMNTQHLRQFMIDSRSFLAGPPEISFWTKEG